MEDQSSKEISKKLEELAKEEDTAVKSIPTSQSQDKITKLAQEDDIKSFKPKDTRSFIEKAAEKYDKVRAKGQDIKKRYVDPIKERYERDIKKPYQEGKEKERFYLEERTQDLERRNKYKEQKVRDVELERRQAVAYQAIGRTQTTQSKPQRRSSLFGERSFGSKFSGNSGENKLSRYYGGVGSSSNKSLLFNSSNTSSNSKSLLFSGSSNSKFNLDFRRKRK